MRSSLVVALLLAVPLAVPVAGGAQAAAADTLAWRRRLLGVYDPATGEPVDGVRVLDVKNGNSSLTTATGTVTLAFLPAGRSMVRVQKVGYQVVVIEVSIAPDDTAPITVELQKIAVPLPAVTRRDTVHYISPGLNGFIERSRLHQGGNFVTEPELRKADNQKMTAVLRRIPGINMYCPRTGARRGECWPVSNRLLTSRGQSTCPLSVYIDGILMTDNDTEKLEVINFAGVELYAGAASLPPQYNKYGNVCGVLLLWSRE